MKLTSAIFTTNCVARPKLPSDTHQRRAFFVFSAPRQTRNPILMYTNETSTCTLREIHHRCIQATQRGACRQHSRRSDHTALASPRVYYVGGCLPNTTALGVVAPQRSPYYKRKERHETGIHS